MTDRIAEIVRDFPRNYVLENEDGEPIEHPRYGVTVIDLGGHPDEVLRVIGERVGRLSVMAPTAANVGIRVFSFAPQPTLDEILARVTEAGYADNWRGFDIAPDIGIVSWDQGNPVQLVIADVPHDESPWHHVLEEGCAWYWVEAEEGS